MEMQNTTNRFQMGVCGLQRKISLQNLMFPFKLGWLWKAKKIIKEFNPDVVISTGGASGPLLK
jgi:UDP-N-acetylglucosamine--N-acetylmuramyl-(pentapeptide) pyrophosphoryl-undecaprenol N-acetylglucosamine transferase